MIRLVVTDLDQTFLTDKSAFSEVNIQAVKGLKAKGVQFGVASGRAPHVIAQMMESAGLIDYLDLIIGYNGVTINVPNILPEPTAHYLSSLAIRSVYEKYKEHPVIFVVHELQTMHCNKESAFSKLEMDLNGYTVDVQPDFSAFIQKDYPKLMLVGDSELLNQIEWSMNEHQEHHYSFFKSHHNFLEVVAPGVSKGAILSEYCVAKGIPLSQVMAIGDNLNDLEMIACVGYGIAVANAVDPVKIAARWITTSNNDNGVAVAIQKFIK